VTVTRQEFDALDKRVTDKVARVHDKATDNALALARVETKMEQAQTDIGKHGDKLDKLETAIVDVFAEYKATTEEIRNVTIDLARFRKELNGNGAAATASREWWTMWREALTPRNVVLAVIGIVFMTSVLADAWKGDLDRAELLEQMRVIAATQGVPVTTELPVAPHIGGPSESPEPTP